MAIGIRKLIAVPRTGLVGIVMARVIEFSIPTRFRKPMKWVREIQRGKLVAFRSQTKKSA